MFVRDINEQQSRVWRGTCRREGQRPVVDDIIIGTQARGQTYNVESGLHLLDFRCGRKGLLGEQRPIRWLTRLKMASWRVVWQGMASSVSPQRNNEGGEKNAAEG